MHKFDTWLYAPPGLLEEAIADAGQQTFVLLNRLAKNRVAFASQRPSALEMSMCNYLPPFIFHIRWRSIVQYNPRVCS